jgi:hypothetical protein
LIRHPEEAQSAVSKDGGQIVEQSAVILRDASLRDAPQDDDNE